MMGTTPKSGLPYPEADTLITDSAAIVQELAEKIDTALSQATAADSYTVPGALVQDFTASGTFTPPQGVSVVHVVVVGGGGNGTQGDGGTSSVATGASAGGAGGTVKVFRDVPVSGPVAVTVGGSETGSAFGGVTASGPIPASGAAVGLSYNCNAASHGGAWGQDGRPGVEVNGTRYAGGGGGPRTSSGTGASPTAGGAGGGGNGGTWNYYAASVKGGNGTNGLGGGAGANPYAYNGVSVGGSGRVMVYTEQAYKSAHVPQPAPDPQIVAALDASGLVLGLYATDPDDPQLPGIDHERLVPFPDTPVDTGRVTPAPMNADDPDGPTTDIPALAWPEVGWTYTDTDGWKEPTR